MGEQPSTYGLVLHCFTETLWLQEGRPSGDKKDNRFLSPSRGGEHHYIYIYVYIQTDITSVQQGKDVYLYLNEV